MPDVQLTMVMILSLTGVTARQDVVNQSSRGLLVHTTVQLCKRQNARTPIYIRTNWPSVVRSATKFQASNIYRRLAEDEVNGSNRYYNRIKKIDAFP